MPTPLTKINKQKHNTMYKMIMNYAPDVLLRDLAQQYADGKMTLTVFADTFASLIDEVRKQNVKLENA